MAPDLGKANVQKAEKSLLAATSTTLNNNEPSIARAIFEVGCAVFGKDDFEGACQEKADALNRVNAKAKKPAHSSDTILKSNLSAEDVLRQEICNIEAEKVGKLGVEIFGKDEYGKARQRHLAKAVATRND